jgi:beta-lactam-binding protein with PASTA domain
MIADYTGRSVAYASNQLQTKNIQVQVIGNGADVISQSPAAGSKVPAGGRVVLYTEAGLDDPNATVPNLIGLSASAANQALINAKLNIQINTGTLSSMEGATAVKQSIAAGEKVKPGTVIVVDFRHSGDVTD